MRTTESGRRRKQLREAASQTSAKRSHYVRELYDCYLPLHTWVLYTGKAPCMSNYTKPALFWAPDLQMQDPDREWDYRGWWRAVDRRLQTQWVIWTVGNLRLQTCCKVDLPCQSTGLLSGTTRFGSFCSRDRDPKIGSVRLLVGTLLYSIFKIF